MKDRTEISILGKDTIVIGQNLFEFIANDLTERLGSICRTFVIITDNYVSKIYLDKFSSTLKHALLTTDEKNGPTPSFSRRILPFVVPSGELSKSRETKAKIEDFLAIEECNRDTCILALGGGVVGDLAGFVASTWNRGIMFVQIPTTLLAMVDSSIGGKNGVDTIFGKNLIGTIYQPARIYIDCDFLLTLPEREFYNGLAEIVKTAAINSVEKFEFLEQNVDNLVRFVKAQNQNERKFNWSKDEQVLEILLNIVTSSVKYKAKIVSMDCKDTGIRNLLNFGHTIGHGIELFLAPTFLHGECVSIGMILESKLGASLAIGNCEVVERLTSLLRKCQLPISLRDEIIKERIYTALPTLSKINILRAMKLDKKNMGGSIQMVLLKEIGVPYKLCAVPVDETKILSGLAELEEDQLNYSTANVCIDASVIRCDSPILLVGEDIARIETFAQILSTRLNYKLYSLITVEDLTHYAHQNLTEAVVHVSSNSQDEIQFCKLWKHKCGAMVVHVTDTSLPKAQQVYEENSDFTFIMLPDNEDQVDRFIHLMQYATGALYNTSLPNPDCRSFFLTILIKDLRCILPKLTSLTNGIHAIEIRVDRLVYDKLSEVNIPELCLDVATQITLLRNVSLVPLIYTLRTNSEGGYLPDNTESEIIKALYTLGIRLGCEILDIEAVSKPKNHIGRVIGPILNTARGKSRIIGSYHHISEPLDWSGPASYTYMDQCFAIGDIAKVVSLGNSQQENRKLEEFLDSYKIFRQKKQIIALNIGRIGQVTRINNSYFTPVTSDQLEPGAGLCQLKIKEILTGATLMGTLEPKHFYLFGSTISHSISPLVHNMIFKYFGFPHTYHLFETAELLNINKLIRNVEFGGASVTMPFKEPILNLLDSLSPSAKEISAVNTIIVQKDGKLHGENTDWLGIKYCIQNLLKSKPESAICFGAGGTALAVIYALKSLGVKNIYIHNRTKARLDKLLEMFPETKPIDNISDLINLPQHHIPSIIVDTTPNDSRICNSAVVNSILKAHDGNGIFVKLAYQGLNPKPIVDESDTLHPNTQMIFGEDILIEQALWQNYFWTGLKMNSQFLRRKVYELIKNT